MNASQALCLFMAFGLATTVLSQAPETSKEVKVDVKKVQVEGQFTPDFTVNYTKPKRWRAKQWLEIDVELEAKKAKVAGSTDTSPMIGSLDFKFYIVLNKRDASGKLTMLTANISYLNAQEKEEQHALAFVSPAGMTRVLEKTNFTTADIQGVGIEIYYNGLLAGGYSSAGGSFWQKTENFSVVDGLILSKGKTPFHPLWGDYDLEAKQ